eukprot:ANDGO_08575.mRNA.1 Myosin-8
MFNTPASNKENVAVSIFSPLSDSPVPVLLVPKKRSVSQHNPSALANITNQHTANVNIMSNINISNNKPVADALLELTDALPTAHLDFGMLLPSSPEMSLVLRLRNVSSRALVVSFERFPFGSGMGVADTTVTVREHTERDIAITFAVDRVPDTKDAVVCSFSAVIRDVSASGDTGKEITRARVALRAEVNRFGGARKRSSSTSGNGSGNTVQPAAKRRSADQQADKSEILSGDRNGEYAVPVRNSRVVRNPKGENQKAASNKSAPGIDAIVASGRGAVFRSEGFWDKQEFALSQLWNRLVVGFHAPSVNSVNRVAAAGDLVPVFMNVLGTEAGLFRCIEAFMDAKWDVLVAGSKEYDSVDVDHRRTMANVLSWIEPGVWDACFQVLYPHAPQKRHGLLECNIREIMMAVILVDTALTRSGVTHSIRVFAEKSPVNSTHGFLSAMLKHFSGQPASFLSQMRIATAFQLSYADPLMAASSENLRVTDIVADLREPTRWIALASWTAKMPIGSWCEKWGVRRELLGSRIRTKKSRVALVAKAVESILQSSSSSSASSENAKKAVLAAHSKTSNRDSSDNKKNDAIDFAELFAEDILHGHRDATVALLWRVFGEHVMNDSVIPVSWLLANAAVSQDKSHLSCSGWEEALRMWTCSALRIASSEWMKLDSDAFWRAAFKKGAIFNTILDAYVCRRSKDDKNADFEGEEPWRIFVRRIRQLDPLTPILLSASDMFDSSGSDTSSFVHPTVIRAQVALTAAVLYHQESLRRAVQVVEKLRQKKNACRAKARSTLQRFGKRVVLMRRSAIKIQGAVRMHKQRSEYQNVRRATVRVQSVMRMAIQQARFHKLRNATLCVQALFRFRKARQAATALQSVFRGFCARKLLAELRHQKLREDSAVRIQNMYRSFCARNVLRDLKQARKERLAASRIQSVFRSHMAQQILAQLKQARLELMSAIKLQSVFRSYKARCLLRELQQAKLELDSAINIQCAFRVFRAKRELASLQRQKLEFFSALCIQSAFRGHAARKALAALRQEKLENESATAIQSIFRMMVAKGVLRTLKQEKLEQDSALAMQCAYRSYLARKALYELRQQKLELDSAIKIQCAFRSHVSRQLLSSLKLAKLQLDSAIRIQSNFRAFSARQLLARLRQAKLELTSALTVQCAFRSFVARRVLSRLRQDRLEFESSIKIQCAIRSLFARKRLAVLKQKKLELDSAITVQCAFRSFCARRALAALKQEKLETDCAIAVQCAWRCLAARKSLAVLRQQKIEQDSSRVIQCAYRCYAARCALATLKLAELRKNSAIVIQCAFRSFVSRTALAALRQERRRLLAAVTIQSAARMFAGKKVVRAMRQGELERVSATKLQCFVRVLRAKAVLRALQVERLQWNSAIRIQSAFRMLCGKRVLNNLKLEKKRWQCAVCIQSVARQMFARAALRALRHERLVLTSAIRLQSVFRMHCGKKVAAALALQKRRVRSATALQAIFRGRRARFVAQRIREARARAASLEYKRESSSIVIQRIWRGYVVRRQLSVASQQKETTAAHVQASRTSKRLYALRERLHQATVRARNAPELILSNRTASALAVLLSSKQLSLVIQACASLQTTVALSSVCAECLCNSGAIPVLVGLIQRCNRSTPHIQVLRHVLNMFLLLTSSQNAGKCVPTMLACEELPEMMAEVLQMFRDKEDIFIRACLVMSQLTRAAGAEKIVNMIPDGPRRIRALVTIMDRKNAISRKMNKENLSSSSGPSKNGAAPAKDALSSSKRIGKEIDVSRLLNSSSDKDMDIKTEECIDAAKKLISLWSVSDLDL